MMMMRWNVLAVACLVGCAPAPSDSVGDSSSGTPTGNTDDDPSADPTANPTGDPTDDPTADPTDDPTGDPTSGSGMTDPTTDTGTSGTDTGTVDTGSSSSTGGDGVQACDPFGDDCPDGFKCVAYAIDGGGQWNANGCFPVVDEPDQLDEACEVIEFGTSGLDTCDVGLMCWDVDLETDVGVCVAQCAGTPDAPECAEDSVCQIANGGVLALCLAPCNPLAQDCGEGNACYPVGDTFVCASVAAAGAQAEGCAFVNTCDAGLACLGGDIVAGCEDFACCSTFCDVADPADPCMELGDGMSCVAWYGPGDAPAGFESVGICAAL